MNEEIMIDESETLVAIHRGDIAWPLVRDAQGTLLICASNVKFESVKKLTIHFPESDSNSLFLTIYQDNGTITSVGLCEHLAVSAAEVDAQEQDE